MKTEAITVVRIYLTEGDHRLAGLIERLREKERVRGLTVFRGIAGFGQSGKLHASNLVDISLDLPLVVEFFDTPARAAEIMSHLNPTVEPGHMISWSAAVNSNEE